MRRLVLTVDVEEDLNQSHDGSSYGVKHALPEIIDILEEKGLECHFFVNGRMCKKHAALIRRISDRGFGVGCHGMDHSVPYLCARDETWQRQSLRVATDLVTKTIGKPIRTFRAPNFSVNTTTIRVLEELGYRIDSSVLPGRVVRKARLRKILDFRRAPRNPYYPDPSDLLKGGSSSILEVPVTENPLNPGAPIGLGYLNSYGLDKTLRALESAEGNLLVFLMHPWEFVDLASIHRHLPSWVKSACRHQPTLLASFLSRLEERFQLTSLEPLLESNDL